MQKQVFSFGTHFFLCIFKSYEGFVFFNFFIRVIFMVENGFSKFLFCNKSQNFKVLQIAF